MTKEELYTALKENPECSSDREDLPDDAYEKPCDYCKGVGLAGPGDPCHRCGGTGMIEND